MTARPDRRSPEAEAYRRWYKSAAWRRIRLAQLAEHPLCANHLRLGKVVPATIVHHIEPHRGDYARFISGPFESVCKECHDVEGRSEDERGYSAATDTTTGLPIDRSHPFNR
jgi:5-methylcytosine-specific restriction protein A